MVVIHKAMMRKKCCLSFCPLLYHFRLYLKFLHILGAVFQQRWDRVENSLFTSALIHQHLFSIVILTPQHLYTLRNHKSLFRQFHVCFWRWRFTYLEILTLSCSTHTVCKNNMSPLL